MNSLKFNVEVETTPIVDDRYSVLVTIDDGERPSVSYALPWPTSWPEEIGIAHTVDSAVLRYVRMMTR